MNRRFGYDARMARYPGGPTKPEASPWLNGDARTLYNHYYSRLAGIAMTRYRWEGLPDNIDPMRLENALVLQGGLAAFTHLRNGDPLADGETEAARGRFAVVKATYGGGKLDDLFNPALYTTYGPNGAGGISFTTTKPVTEWAGVPIWGDSARMDYDGQTILTFANRLARASLVVDVNMAATTRGVVIVAESQDTLLTQQTAMETALSGLPTIVTDEKTIDAMKALNLGVHPETVERSHVVAMRLWNEALTALGVQAGAAEKEERLTDDEVQAIRGAVQAVRRRTLMPRRLAAQQINRRYFGAKEVVQVVDQW